MAIKILINGAFGRMGQLTAEAIKDNVAFELVGQTSREYDLKKSIKDSGAEVVVDFTHPESVYHNTVTIIEAQARPIIGTSGLKRDQITKLAEKCEKLKLGGIIAPNFSLGAVLMLKCAKEIARYMPHVEVIEMHHEKKADSPSGTAIRTVEVLADAIQTKTETQLLNHETIPGARGAVYEDIHVHAIRLPGLLAHQQIIFGEPGETLTLRHDTIDRKCFMPGIRLACEKVMRLDHLVYGLEDVI